MVSSHVAKYGIDINLKANLDICTKFNQSNADSLIITAGIEGSGKSYLTMQAAYYLDRTFTADRMCFTADEFVDSCIDAKQYQAVVFDEAISTLFNRQAMTKDSIRINKMLAQIRQKNLYMFICIPNFFYLDEIPAVIRSRALIHVYQKGLDRGYFKFFNTPKKKQLYKRNKKAFTYYGIAPNFSGRFVDYNVLGQAYLDKKLKALEALKSYRKDEIDKKETKQNKKNSFKLPEPFINSDRLTPFRKKSL